MSDAEFQEIKLRAILKKPDAVLVQMLKQVVPDVVVQEPQPVVHELVVEAEENVEPAVIAPVVIPKINDEDVDKDKDSEMDLEEDIDAVAPGPPPATDIAQITAIWAAEMAAQQIGRAHV